uniref:Lipocalin/cytosolic fatty-acid binding domain-containing protein n=1 Tax=Balaenoptera musculus TaxID=9771 RepID=A0A8C0CP10_BALMU
MRGEVLAALLGLFVALAAGVEDLSLKDFDFAQFSGIWYKIAFAPNLEPQGSPRTKKMGAVMVEQEGPHLALTSVSDHVSRCVKEKSQAVKGDAPGKFKLPMESGGKEVTVVATDCKTYAIMNVVFRKGGKAHSVLKLYSRMVEHNEKAMDRFLVKALEHGLSAVGVQLLSKDRECPGPGQASLPAPISPCHRLLFSTVTCVNLLP